jgi:hypothetical protein
MKWFFALWAFCSIVIVSVAFRGYADAVGGETMIVSHLAQMRMTVIILQDGCPSRSKESLAEEPSKTLTDIIGQISRVHKGSQERFGQMALAGGIGFVISTVAFILQWRNESRRNNSHSPAAITMRDADR